MEAKKTRKWRSFFANKKVIGPILFLLILGYVLCLPTPLFQNPVCKVLFDRDEQLLGASIATDGQWRFPPITHIPDKFKTCIVEFEDRRFFSHPGFDIKGIIRAINQNIRNKKIVSGASTLSMQVIRMSRPGKSRNVFRKAIEMVQATRLELKFSKEEILALYASHAPFGGNVVGLEAASWRYFAKGPELLSWAEAAVLAVLPNSPSLMHPGKNRDKLLAKRNRLLHRLAEQGHIDATTLELSLEESLPEKPLPLPNLAPHLLHTAFAKTERKTPLHSSLDLELQKKVNGVLLSHKNELNAKGVHNACALVIDLKTSKVLSYVGNMPEASARDHGQVDIIRAPRSTGSILKPILSMLMLDEGLYLPGSLLPDIPTHLSGYRPENYKITYDGVSPLNEALQRSLNIPFVRALQNYGLEKFHHQLKQLGFSHLNKSANHYGLTLILGGAEASLWDLCKVYAGASKTLSHFTEEDAQYFSDDFQELSILHQEQPRENFVQDEAFILGAASIWHTFENMKKVQRPNSEGDWKSFRSAKKIAWKTGTSFGFRDAWSIGLTKDYLVGVWVGNADGEGKSGLIGVEMAAPILFDVFRGLPNSSWYDPPYDDMLAIPVCKKSGFRALSGICESDSLFVPLRAEESRLCPYHQTLHLDEASDLRVHDDCRNVMDIRQEPWFILPPAEAHYFKKINPSYKDIPPYAADCISRDDLNQASANALVEHGNMQFIYPRNNFKIYIPLELSGKSGKTVFKVAHRNEEEVVHWHLDDTYLGSTQHFHHMELSPSFGAHTITLVDENGEVLERGFEILSE